MAAGSRPRYRRWSDGARTPRSRRGCVVVMWLVWFVVAALSLASSSTAFVGPPTVLSVSAKERSNSYKDHVTPQKRIRSFASAPPWIATEPVEAPTFFTATTTTPPPLTNAWYILAGAILQCLLASDQKRDRGTDGASTGWTSWVDDTAAMDLQATLEPVQWLEDYDDDNGRAWLRWMKDCPAPLVMDLTPALQKALEANYYDKTHTRPSASATEREDRLVNLLSRVSCQCWVLPSGQSLPEPLRTPPGALVYGKLLYGGVHRYRQIGQSSTRRAGERQGQCLPHQAPPVWLQYGGPLRQYQAMDIGPCGLLEVTLLPEGLQLYKDAHLSTMRLSGPSWDPTQVLDLWEPPANETKATTATTTNVVVVDELSQALKGSLGGLDDKIDQIVRRVLFGRDLLEQASTLLPSSLDLGVAEGANLNATTTTILQDMGLTPVRGLLLYGPPGTGKSAMARRIGQLLVQQTQGPPPKIVEAPALLDRKVGGTERNVRALFQDAEADRASGQTSALHVIVIDECDAIFRRRSSAMNEGTRASAVNQILSKLDGVYQLDNILLIALTNRHELLDPALLRPGRLEVHVELPLPDRQGRREILQLLFGSLRQEGRLSRPLCQALDGEATFVSSLSYQGWFRLRRRWKSPIRDLADDRWTAGFSGADLEGLLRSAGSLARDRCRRQGDGSLQSMMITLEDVYQALNEVHRKRR